MKLVIPFTLPGLNDYIEAERAHRQKGAALKRKCQRDIMLAIKRQVRPLREPVVMHYVWVEKDRRRDKDNVSSFGRKIIQDTLVQMKVLRNDGWANIEKFIDDFQVDKKHPRIEIEIQEAGEMRREFVPYVWDGKLVMVPVLTEEEVVRLGKDIDLQEMRGRVRAKGEMGVVLPGVQKDKQKRIKNEGRGKGKKTGDTI